MANFEYISANQAYGDLAGGDALLVNGYDDEEKWQNTRVNGATSFMDFQRQASSFPKNRELIFYCA
jgi:hypothetical protein